MFYALGQQAALIKLGMKLTFDNPQEASEHYKNRETVSKWTGGAGDLAGSMIGGTAGSVAGPVGTVGGSVAGAEIGGRVGSGVSNTLYDAGHDVQQRTKDTYQSSMAGMNAAAGMPTGTS